MRSSKSYGAELRVSGSSAARRYDVDRGGIDVTGVCCTGCGRLYDEARFAFGATLWCTCGRRVGALPASREEPRRPAGEFAADAMLARLARWLRLFGFDCVLVPLGDRVSMRGALAGGRAVLTASRVVASAWRHSAVVRIESADARSQLVEVIRRFDLAHRIAPLTRCGECNGLLEPVSRAEAAAFAPPRVVRKIEAFTRCRDCGKTYWEGTHAAAIRAVARDVAARARG